MIVRWKRLRRLAVAVRNNRSAFCIGGKRQVAPDSLGCDGLTFPGRPFLGHEMTVVVLCLAMAEFLVWARPTTSPMARKDCSSRIGRIYQSMPIRKTWGCTAGVQCMVTQPPKLWSLN